MFDFKNTGILPDVIIAFAIAKQVDVSGKCIYSFFKPKLFMEMKSEANPLDVSTQYFL